MSASKKKNRKEASPTLSTPMQPETAGVVSLGYDEMLSELEAIAVEVEICPWDEGSLA